MEYSQFRIHEGYVGTAEVWSHIVKQVTNVQTDGFLGRLLTSNHRPEIAGDPCVTCFHPPPSNAVWRWWALNRSVISMLCPFLVLPQQLPNLLGTMVAVVIPYQWLCSKVTTEIASEGGFNERSPDSRPLMWDVLVMGGDHIFGKRELAGPVFFLNLHFWLQI